MTSTQDSELKIQDFPDLDIINWENTEPLWQEKIKQLNSSQSSPSYLIYPHTQKALSSIMKYAYSHSRHIIPCGGGSKLSWGGLAQNIQLLISTQKLNRIVEHAVDDLTVTVEAGVKLVDIQKILNQTGQFLPLDITYPEIATIGGIVATADSGSWRQRYGGVRDMVLGLSLVRSDGEIAKAGGRVVKNVAGYDLMKLFTGSYGTLGIISQVTFRVYPLPEASETIVLIGEINALTTATQTLLNSPLTPTAADVLSASVVKSLELGQGMGLAVRFQTIPESIKEQTAKLESVGEQLGLQISFYANTDEADLWNKLSRITSNCASTTAITCKIGVLSTGAVKILHKLAIISSDSALGIIHIGSGLGRLKLENEDSIEQIKELRSLCQKHRGFLSILEAPIPFKQQIEPWGYTGNALNIMKKLKQQFDPKNILNTGRFVGGI